MKVLIFDSSTLINLIINGLEEILPLLKKESDIRFIVPASVRFETIKRPIQTKKYELGALKIKTLFDEGILESPSVIGVDEQQLEIESKRIMDDANKILWARGQPVHLIERGESSCLALYNMLRDNKRIDKMALAVDERTTRMLVEKPENLRKLMESKLHTRIDMKTVPEEFQDMVFIRSAEIVYIAYKKNLVNLKNGQVLDALLYASKFAGCSITIEEIEEMKKL
jgi:hypothetical protein